MNKNELTGKVAIVTGAGQGMGKAIALLLASKGIKVVIADINEVVANNVADEIGALGVKVDVTKEDEVESMANATLEKYGRIDILVNNAGVLRPTKIEDISKKEWDFVLDVNLNGTFLCTKAVLKTMKKNGYGRIVNMSSSAGRSVSTIGGAHYTAAKAAILGFTRAVAKETASFGVTVNSVCPGLIDTEMVRSDCSVEQIDKYEKSFPIHRLGTPEEVAALVLFLISDAAYITGAAIDINGGDLMI